MPFRAPLPSQDPAVLRPSPSPSPSPSSSGPTSSPSPARPPLPAPAPAPATLRLPAPPPPPKPLYLSTRRRRFAPTSSGGESEEDEEGGAGGIRERGYEPRGSAGAGRSARRGALPRWSVAAGDDGDGEEDEADGGGTVKALTAAAGGRTAEDDDDAQQRRDARAALEALFAPQPTASASTAPSDEPSSPPHAARESSIASTSASSEAYRTPVGTLKAPDSGGGGAKRASTIRMRDRDGRASIYFDAARENPFVPPPRSPANDAGVSTAAAEAAAVKEDDAPLLALPHASVPAVALHGFDGEPSFGELSFVQGASLRIEIEDLGGGWSLGWVKEEGEGGRGLVPRGWYAYIDVAPPPADGSLLPTPAPSAEVSPSHPSLSTVALPDVPSASSSRSASPSLTNPAGASTSTPFSPSSALAALALSAATSPEPSPPSTPLQRAFSRSAAPSPATPASLPRSPTSSPTPSEYATRSIGRDVVVSGIEFEPTWEEAVEEDTEREDGEEGERSVEELLRAQEEREEPLEEREEPVEEREEPVEEAWPRPMERIEHASGVDAATVEADDPAAADVEETAQNAAGRDELDAPAPPVAARAGSPIAAVRPAPSSTPPRPNPPSGSFLFRLGLVPSSAPSASSAFSLLLPAIGRVPVPGASVLAATAAPPSAEHARRLLLPRLASTRRVAAPSAQEGTALLLRWVEEGDALDDEVGDAGAGAGAGAGAQRWDVDAGPAWRTSEAGAYEVFVREGRKVSPLGETAYVAFEVETVFPPLAVDDGDGDADEPRVLSVSRRYSHFLTLHTLLAARFCAPLIAIPPLPPKAPLAFGAARFDPALVETRRRELEAWLRRCGRHPVLRTCEEMRGFLAIEGEKLAQHLLLTPSSPPAPPLPLFPARVFHPAFNIDLGEAQDLGDRFEAHCRAMEVGGGWKAVEEAVRRGREGKRAAANDMQLLAHSLVRLSSGAALPPASYDKLLPRATPPYDEEEGDADRLHRRAREWGMQNEAGALSWRDEDDAALGVSKAVQAAGEAVAGVADAKDESACTALLDVEALLHEGVSPLSQHAPLIDLHRSLLTLYSRLSRLSSSDPLAPHEQLARCETLLNVTCAEMERIRAERTEDLAEAVRGWLEEEVREREEALSHLTTALSHFSPSALSDLALTGPRLRSPLEAQREPRTYAPLPVAGVYGRAGTGGGGSAEGVWRARTVTGAMCAARGGAYERAATIAHGQVERAGSWRESLFGTRRGW